MSPAQRELAVKRIYDRIPLANLSCRGFCWDSCGAIGYSQAEAKVIAFKHGSPPMAVGLQKGTFTESGDIMCDKLTPDKRCSIYEDRPLICRTYGLMRQMQCPHGCVPTEWLDDNEMVVMLIELEALEGKHEPSHQLAALVSAAAKRQGVR